MKHILICLSIFITAVIAHANEAPYKIKVTRNGVTHLQVAANFWQGEYPGPVIDISSKKKGTTTIKGWSSLRVLNQRKACTVQNGLYHPWSTTGNSVINYYTLVPVFDYLVLKPLSEEILSSFYEVENVKIQPGDQIINVVYGGEGYSIATLVQGQKQTQIGLFWDVLDMNPDFFSQTLKTAYLVTGTYDDGTVYETTEQWLYLNCKEGYKVFAEVNDLLQQKNIKEGQITGYGEVSSAR